MIVPEELRPFYLAFDPPAQRAALLVVIANAAASATLKSRYRKRWWQMLEERVRLAALTESTLVGWSSQVSSRLSGQIARNPAHRDAWQDVIRAGDDASVLRSLERETPALIGFTRAWSDARREEFLAREEEDGHEHNPARF